jgi:hypothetical protein
VLKIEGITGLVLTPPYTPVGVLKRGEAETGTTAAAARAMAVAIVEKRIVVNKLEGIVQKVVVVEGKSEVQK